jgi:hypothetical protein
MELLLDKRYEVIVAVHLSKRPLLLVSIAIIVYFSISLHSLMILVMSVSAYCLVFRVRIPLFLWKLFFAVSIFENLCFLLVCILVGVHADMLMLLGCRV